MYSWASPTMIRLLYRVLLTGASAACVLFLTNAFTQTAHAAGEPVGQVTILHDTHIHGRYYNPTNLDENIANLFGAANIIKQSKPNALYLANGDDIATSVISDVFNGKHVIDAFNASIVDADTYGNHDFDYGTDVLRQRVAESRFPWITANVIDTRTHDVFGKEQGAIRYMIKEVNGVKVGLTGLGRKSPFMDSTVSVLSSVTAMQQVIPLMKADGADIIVVMSHLAKKEAESLAAKVNGIDVLVGDHSENVLDQPEKITNPDGWRTILSFRGCEFEYLGELTLHVSGGKVATFEYIGHKITEEVAKPGFLPDPNVKAVMDSYLSQLNVSIGQNTVPLELRSTVIRKKESNFGNYVADVVRAWKNSDVALMNSGHIFTNQMIQPGDITKRNVIDILPYTNQLVLLSVTGQQILDALENGVSRVEISDGRFPQVSGMTFSYDYNLPSGQRIVNATIGGVPLNPAATYTLTTTDYLSSGAYGYTVFTTQPAKFLTDPATGPLLTTTVMQRIQQDSSISPQLEGRIVAVDNTPPVTTARVSPSSPSGSNGWYIAKAYLSLIPNNDLSGIMKTEYRINGGAWMAYTLNQPLAFTKEGRNAVEYRSTDNAGNVEAIKSININVDLTPPVTNAAATPPSGESAYSSDVTVSLSATDATSGIAKTEYRVNGGSWEVYNDAIAFSQDGTYLLEYRSTDVAGKAETAKTLSFAIAKPVADVTAPVTTVALDPAQPDGTDGWYVSGAGITLSASDDLSGIAETEYRLNGGIWETYNTAFPVTVDGINTVEYRSSDAAGNVETIKSATVKLDQTAPVTTAVMDPASDGGPYSTDVTVTLTADDSGSGVAKTEYRVNGGSWDVYNGALTFSQDGTYSVEYRSTDSAGNVETVKTFSFSIAKPVSDVTAPVTNFALDPLQPDGTDGWYVTGAGITLSASDDLSGVAKTEYRFNGGIWETYNTAFPVTVDGINTLEYRSSDAAGNVETIKSVTVKLDQTAPVTTAAMDPAFDGGPYSTDVTVTLTADDSGFGVAKTEYRVNGGSWDVYNGALTLSQDGTYSVEYLSTDAAGNVETVKTLSFAIAKPVADVTAPVTASELSPSQPGGSNGWYLSDVAVSYSASDDLSGISKTEYRLNGGEWITYTGSYTISSDGVYTVDYRSTDHVGNVETMKSDSVSLDKTAPITASSIVPASNDGTYTSDVTVTLTGTDGLSGVAVTEYRVNGAEWNVYTNPVSFSQDGMYGIDFRSTDRAGNMESLQSQSFTISKPLVGDITAPVTTAARDPAEPGGTNGWYVTGVGLTLSAIDDLSGVMKTEYSTNGGVWTVYTSKLMFSTDGSYRIDYHSTDGAGNVEPTQTFNINIDKTIPSTTYKFNSAPTGSNGWYKTKVYFYLYPKDNWSGVATTEYRINGGSWITFVSGSVAFLTDGKFVIDYRSTDAAGNVKLVSSLAINVDKTAPVTTATVNTASTGGSTLTLNAAEATSGIASTEYSVNGGTWVVYGAPVQFSVKGAYTVEYRSTDLAGNVEATKLKSFTI